MSDVFPAMINNLIPRLKNFRHDCIYDLTAYQRPSLCVDVGAAAGVVTQKLKQINPTTRVIAFEPFPGNHPYFARNTREFSGVDLIKKAVADHSGTATFRVDSVVQGTEPRWEGYAGYSSIGFLVDDPSKVPATAQNLTVETTSIDAEIDRRIDFMKIDVQGGEFGVLQGAKRTIAQHGIDVMYIEFDGRDKRVLNFLADRHYTLFDTDYLIIPSREVDFSELAEAGFYDFRSVGLSTGRTAIRAKLVCKSNDYCEFLTYCLKKFGYTWTDLIAVSPHYLDRFMDNLGRWVSGIKSDALNFEISHQQYPAYWSDRVAR